MANLTSTDPIEHQSTRVCAVETSITLATYDLYKWGSSVYNNFDGNGTNFTIDSMVNVLGFNLFSNFYGGIDSNYQLIHDPEIIKYRKDVDMLEQLSSDNPPLYIENNSIAKYPKLDIYHHSLQAHSLMKAAKNANLPEVLAKIPYLNINNTAGEIGREFLVRQLNYCSLPTNIKESNKSKNLFIISPTPARASIQIKAL